MTYFGFLLRFLVVPILIVLALIWVDRRRGRQTLTTLRSWPVWLAITLHILIAVAYTTPWDNYLVATRVWWYDPDLVTGITLGWVPIEEYTFFVLQPILGGLWLTFLMQRIQVADEKLRSSLRFWSVLPLGVIWLAMSAILISGWQPGTYLALELLWALPPIILQLGFGADILWLHRRLIFWSIIPLTLFLSFVDALAINWGTWTINPQQSLEIYLGGVLPLEEFVFFLLTNTLLTFGVVLVLAKESQHRLASFKELIGFRKQTANQKGAKRPLSNPSEVN